MRPKQRKGSDQGWDNAPDAVLQQWNVEVDQYCERELGELEVRPRLGGVDSRQSLDGLELYDNPFANDHVDPGLADHDASVVNLGWDLGLDLDPAKLQLDYERSLVDPLEMAGAEHSVHRNRRSDDDAGEVVGGLSWFSITLCLGPLGSWVLTLFLSAEPRHGCVQMSRSNEASDMTSEQCG